MLKNNKNLNIQKNITYLLNLIKFTKKENFLFVFPKKVSYSNRVFFRALKENDFNVLPKWPAGFISNFYQMCNSYKNLSYFSFLFDFDLSQLKFIFLDSIPNKNTDEYKEIILLKRTLNVNVIAFIEISNKYIKTDKIVDIPIFFTNVNNSNYSDQNLTYFTILKHFLR